MESDLPKCPTCGAPLKKKGSKFLKYCSIKCSANNPETKRNRQETCLKKYGTLHHLQNKTILNKQKETNLKRFGQANVSSLDKVKQKRKTTCKEKYGTEYFLGSDISKTKRKDTCREKYGVDQYSQTQECKDKIIHTCQEKYETNNPSTLALREHISQESLNNLNNKEWLIEQHHNLKKSHREIAKALGVTQSLVSCKCEDFDIETKYFGSSMGEHELADFLQTFYPHQIITNTRSIISPKELDIYLPDSDIAIEYNGAYYHSKQDEKYHLSKTEDCLKKNIQLFHVYDFEWLDDTKQEIWKSMLKTKLGFPDTKRFARKCIIQSVNFQVTKEFLINNHLQGTAASSLNLGLYYNNELVSLMTFSKARFNKKYEWELVRFCNRLNTQVVGGASKLLHHFEKEYQPKSIVSYADRRYSNGSLYNTLNFNFDHVSKPNYHYKKDVAIFSRIKFQKHKLAKILTNFDSNLTEFENMSNNGYIKFFDAGNLAYTKIY
jgi:hypothetical protein